MEDGKEDLGREMKRMGILPKVAVVAVMVVVVLALAVGVAFAVTNGGTRKSGGAGAASRLATSDCGRAGGCNASPTGVCSGKAEGQYNTDCPTQGAGDGHGCSMTRPSTTSPAR